MASGVCKNCLNNGYYTIFKRTSKRQTICCDCNSRNIRKHITWDDKLILYKEKLGDCNEEPIVAKDN